MNDRELLEMAAKAAGYEYIKPIEGYGGSVGLQVGSTNPMRTSTWNPLKDDGDALRLAVRLELKISHRSVDVDVSRGHASASEYVTTYFGRSEATRRAIVRAAARLGAAAQKVTP